MVSTNTKTQPWKQGLKAGTTNGQQAEAKIYRVDGKGEAVIDGCNDPSSGFVDLLATKTYRVDGDGEAVIDGSSTPGYPPGSGDGDGFCDLLM